MKKQVLCIVLLLSFVPSNEAQSKKVTSRAQLLEVGDFHGDEVNARTSNGWLGLFVSKKNSSLLPTSIRVSKVFDPVIDLDTKKLTGKRVSIPQSIAPIFLVRNVPSLEPGNVKTILDKLISLHNGNEVSLKLGKHLYRIKVESSSRDKKIYFGKANVQLILGGVKQSLFSSKGEEEGGFSIIWAGDLDGDGKLDLYVNAMPHENVESRMLFLSSQAAQGQLVQEVVRFTTTGC